MRSIWVSFATLALPLLTAAGAAAQTPRSAVALVGDSSGQRVER